MKYLILIFFLTTLLISNSCNKNTEGETRINNFEVPIVTGFNFKNEEGSSMGAYGGPVNNKVGDGASFHEHTYYLNAFPNPASDSYMVYTKKPSTLTPYYIWIVQASYNGSLTNIELNNNAITLVAGGAPLIEYRGQSEMIRLDISSLQEGYYRIYVDVGDVILYDNLVVYRGTIIK